MGRPTHPNQCITLDQESNNRMRAAWRLNPQHGQTVFVVRGGDVESQEWLFSHFTRCGARLYSGRHSALVDWQKGDRVFVDIKEARTIILLNAMSKSRQAREILAKYDEIIQRETQAIK